MFVKGTKGLVPFCFRLNENTIDKTKKLEVKGHNFIIFHDNCEKLLGSLYNEVTFTPLQSTPHFSSLSNVLLLLSYNLTTIN